jgi:hypothetical protein
MDKVASHPLAADQIDREIAVALEDWASLPQMEDEWDEWDDDSRFSFLVDWPVIEERTARVLALEASFLPGDDRVDRVRMLRDLVERNRPVLARLRSR